MTRIALANLPYPASPDDSVTAAELSIAEAARSHADILCFPECFIPGYRGLGKTPPSPDAAFLHRAHTTIAASAARANVAVILGIERLDGDRLFMSALVIDRTGAMLGIQDKVQLDPSEGNAYSPAHTSARRVFQVDDFKFGIAICHEGFRYPETVRAAARQGAHCVFHPHYAPPEPGSYRPTTFADPANSFHEKATLCRAAENTIYFATVNYATEGSPTTSAVINPDGTLLTQHPYGAPGLLIADLDLRAATGLLAARYRPA